MRGGKKEEYSGSQDNDQDYLYSIKMKKRFIDLLPEQCSCAVFDERKDGVVLRVWARPGAKRDTVLGSKQDEKDNHWLHISVKAVPEDGKANAALVAFLAKIFGLKRNAIRLMQGETNSKKLFFIEAAGYR